MKRAAALVALALALAIALRWSRPPSVLAPSPGPLAQAEARAGGTAGFVADGDVFKARGGSLAVEVRADGTVALSAGASPTVTLATRAGRAQVELGREGQLVLRRHGVTEELTVERGGLEQAWRFERAPAKGPLEVAVDVAGWRYEASTARGAIFRAPGGAATLVYGLATWIDAKGARTPVPARVEGERLTLAVEERVLATTTWPAVLDPLVSVAVDVGAYAGVARAAGSHTSPAIAATDANGGLDLVVWEDGRKAGDNDLWAAVLSGQGLVL